MNKRTIIDNKNVNASLNTPLGRIRLLVAIQVFNYIKYALTTPAIIFYAIVISIIISSILNFFQDLVFGSSFKPLLDIFKVLGSSIGKFDGDILTIYGWLSLIFYIIGILVEKIFKIKIFLSFMKKLKLFLFINLLLFLVFFTVFLIRIESLAFPLLIVLLFSLFTILAVIPAILGYIFFDKIINSLQKLL